MSDKNPIREVVKVLVIKVEQLPRGSKAESVVNAAIDSLNELDESSPS